MVEVPFRRSSFENIRAHADDILNSAKKAERKNKPVSAKRLLNAAAGILEEGLMDPTVAGGIRVDLGVEIVTLYSEGGAFSSLIRVAPKLLEEIGEEFPDQRDAISKALASIPKYS